MEVVVQAFLLRRNGKDTHENMNNRYFRIKVVFNFLLREYDKL